MGISWQVFTMNAPLNGARNDNGAYRDDMLLMALIRSRHLYTSTSLSIFSDHQNLHHILFALAFIVIVIVRLYYASAQPQSIASHACMAVHTGRLYRNSHIAPNHNAFDPKTTVDKHHDSHSSLVINYTDGIIIMWRDPRLNYSQTFAPVLLFASFYSLYFSVVGSFVARFSLEMSLPGSVLRQPSESNMKI